MKPRRMWLVAGASLLCACASTTAQPSVAAVLSQSDDESRAALMAAVKEALDGRDVTLADDALTKTSSVLIEPARPRDDGGRLLQGRETRPAEAFHLVKQGNECVLVHDRTAKEFVLQGVKCVEENG